MSTGPKGPDRDPFRRLREHPLATMPAYQVGESDLPIPLFQGIIHLEHDSTTTVGQGEIRLDWYPTPGIAFELKVPGSPWYGADSVVKLRLGDAGEQLLGFVTRWHFDSKESASQSLFGWLGRTAAPESEPHIARLTFLVPNFLEVVGDPIRYSERRFRRGRIELVADGWRVVIDPIDHPKGFWRELKNNRGFAVTHTGFLERVNGSAFTWDEAKAIHQALRWFLTWSLGSWTGPILTCGEDSQRGQAFQLWDVCPIAPAKEVSSWFDPLSDEQLILSFPGFLRLWLDENWTEVLRMAVHWYVEANAQAGSAEGSIILTQTAFEMLASKVLGEAADRLNAEARLRALFKQTGIPVDIPDSQKALAQLAKIEGWIDIPQALVKVRNPLTHPTTKNLDRYRRYPAEAIFDVWTLGVWCLELLLLKVCGYEGKYACRLAPRWAGEVQKVPYAP